MLRYLHTLLTQHGIDYKNKWGVGEAKAFENLVSDITLGEAQLVSKNRTLIWKSRCSSVLVTFQDLVLVEDRQVFSDGRIRRRPQHYGTSVNEKLRPLEKPLDGALRAMREELGISIIDPSELKFLRESLIEAPSQSYPGLISRYTRYEYGWEALRGLYVPRGYVERQGDKTTYFVWKHKDAVRAE